MPRTRENRLYVVPGGSGEDVNLMEFTLAAQCGWRGLPGGQGVAAVIAWAKEELKKEAEGSAPASGSPTGSGPGPARQVGAI